MSESGAVAEKRILIVDDEYSIREALLMFFNDKGFITKEAKNGIEALDFIEKEDFDIIVSDIRMDKMDGIELIKKLKSYNKKTPVIFITAYPELNTAIEALRHGVIEYVIKPFDMRELEQKVFEALKNKSETSEEVLKEKFKKQKQEFINRFSRELKTPLTPLAAYVQLLIKEEFGVVTKYQVEVLEKIQKNGKRLKVLVDDLVLLFSLESKDEKPDIGKHSIVDLINEITEEEKDFLKEKEQDFSVTVYDDIEWIMCDGAKIKRVIFHLFDNAVKFSPESTSIEITVRNYEYNKNSYIKFSVKDSSERLKEDNKRVVFKWFYEINKAGDYSDVSDISGLGIGLTLSKLIVEAHEGRIWLEDEKNDENEGNIFSFIIPK